jgi:hypothetical protein
MRARKKQLNKYALKKNNILDGKSNNEKAEEKFGENFRISFQYLDEIQGQTFEEWEKEGILADAMRKLREHCRSPLRQQLGANFKEYGPFPNPSDFCHPKHVPHDVNWAALHLTGKRILAGYVYENTFFVVFLDKEHQFWRCYKKHT